MEAKEKARTLIVEFQKSITDYAICTNGTYNAAKQCALDCCDEVISAMEELHPNMHNFYWSEVRTEVEKFK